MPDANLVDTTVVRASHRIDEARLAHWMAHSIIGFEPPVMVEQFSGGQSNPTYRLTTRAKTYVLRRKPPGELLAGAHAVDREARVMQALGTTDFPVPHVYALCMDESVVGTPFYIMDYVRGRVIWDVTFPQVSREQRPLYFHAMVQTLAKLHRLDYVALALGDYGRPGGFVQRQIARWSKQYLADIPYAGHEPAMDRLVDWLRERQPAEEDCSLVHGDFRVDNMIFDPCEPKILAVLDWELSTLGNPVADFAYHLMMYRMPPGIVAGLLGSNLPLLNVPDEAASVASYCDATGRADIDHLDFYIVFNLFRLAAIFHGIKGRLARGTASSLRAGAYADQVAATADLAWAQALCARAGR